MECFKKNLVRFCMFSALAAASSQAEFSIKSSEWSSGEFRMILEGAPSRETFEVQSTTNFTRWQSLATVTAENSEVTVILEGEVPTGFFRLQLLRGTFGAPIRLQDSNSGALGTCVGNLDEDPQDEFVSVSSRSSADPHLRIYDYSPAEGTWRKYEVISASAVEGMQDRFGTHVVIADIDGDGDNDIATIDSSNRGNSGKMLWFENPGTLKSGWETHTVTTWSGSGTGRSIRHSEIEAGDINNDGHQDLVARDISHGVYVLIQEAPFDGTKWAPRKFIATNPREGIALADIDQDKDLDIVINGVWFETPSDPVNGTYEQRTYGRGWYPSGASSDQIDDYACQVVTADFDGDGDLDIVITNSEELANASSTTGKPQGIRVYLCPEDPKNDSWTEVILHSKYYSWHSCEVADFDMDGDLDVISAVSPVGVDPAAALVMLFRNDGTGHSFAQESIGVEPVLFHYQMSAGDYDGDGDPDLFAPQNWSTGPHWLYENLHSQRAPVE